MKRLTFGLIAASVLMLTACASLAPYGPQQAARGQGFSEQRIEANRFRVTYNGVGAPGPVADRALFRAAQLTVDQGYDWFEVTQRWIDGRPDSAGGVRPSISIGAGSSRYGGWSTSGVGVGLGFDLSGPQPTSTTLEIVLGRGPRPGRPGAYDARGVQDAIRPRL
ncbi:MULTISPECIES: CC0125/CC1285 family lipoprotein [unclassified Brevundimonas]|uniref:CC0125/CC1285 family lipoprotein n=1 Tax=unclassified Brevundimonas TaxID=2622653 RepID=UPI003F9158E1